MLPVWNGEAFGGAKLGLILDGRVLTYLRDDKPGIPYPNCWDLPGGGREGNESPVNCVLRELTEEFGLQILSDRLTKGRGYSSPGGQIVYFYLGDLWESDLAKIRFGDEGQYWKLMPVADYLRHAQAVPALQQRLADCFKI
ncbi:MAG: NUDIX hydrolase [Pseudomonadota bacterium]